MLETKQNVIGFAVLIGAASIIALAFQQRKKKRRLVHPKSIPEFEEEAEHKLSPLAKIYFGYKDGQGYTSIASREAFGRIRLQPKILTGDLSRIDTSISLFGTTMKLPVWIAPTAFHYLACPEEGEVATARGAAQSGAGYCYNWMLSNRLCEDVVKESPGGCKWLHMYMFEERELVQKAIQAAEATGQFSAIILTCDHPHNRVANRMLPYYAQLRFPDQCYKNTPFFANQATLGGDIKYEITLEELLAWKDSDGVPGGTNSTKLSWEDVKWIKSITKLPIVAKGILTAEDAESAVQSGCSAVVVSNHGARQFDGAPPAIEALPMVVAAVADHVPVLVDSGIRSSTDILKALCLGAKGVLLGRPALWALSCGGSDGLFTMLDMLRQDLTADMMSLGVRSLAELGPSHIWPPDRERIASDMRACGMKPFWA